MLDPTCKLTPVLQRQYCELVADGVPRMHAAWACGVDPDTVRNWIKRGDRGEPIFSDFSAAVKRAQADAVADRVRLIKAASKDGSWQAAAWWLERRHPSEFGRSDRDKARERKQQSQTSDTRPRVREVVVRDRSEAGQGIQDMGSPESLP